MTMLAVTREGGGVERVCTFKLAWSYDCYWSRYYGDRPETLLKVRSSFPFLVCIVGIRQKIHATKFTVDFYLVITFQDFWTTKT
jgi:hypothetical protein